MKKDRMAGYRVKGSIDTLSVKSEGLLQTIPENVKSCISSASREVETEERHKEIVCHAKINPNNLYFKNGLHIDVSNYSTFLTVLDTITTNAGLKDFEIVRCDFALDSDNKDFYLTYSKLNTFLISLLAQTYSVKNRYVSFDLFNRKLLSVAVKSRYFQAEYYNKERESSGKANAKSRFEIRSKKESDKILDIKKSFCEDWKKRFKKALNNIDKTQDRYNQELKELYFSQVDKKPYSFKSVNEFLRQHQDCIFTRKQLVNLLLEIEDDIDRKTAEIKADNFKKRNGIEYVSVNEIKKAIKEIERAIDYYFNN